MTKKSYELVDFKMLQGVPCPCGTARRAFAEVEDFPATIHVTEIALDNQLHYHKRLTETYFILIRTSGNTVTQLNGHRWISLCTSVGRRMQIKYP